MRESVFTHTTPPPFAARVCCAVAGLEAGVPLLGLPGGVAAVGAAAGLLAVSGEAAGVSDRVCAAASVCFGFLSFLAVLESALGESPACCGACACRVTASAVNSNTASSVTRELFPCFILEGLYNLWVYMESQVGTNPSTGVK